MESNRAAGQLEIANGRAHGAHSLLVCFSLTDAEKQSSLTDTSLMLYWSDSIAYQPA